MAKLDVKTKVIEVYGNKKDSNGRKGTLSVDNIRKMAKICNALDHKLRKSILEYISSAGQSEVKGIYSSMKIEQSVCSQQLSILRNAGILSTERNGKEIIYSINIDSVQYIETGLKIFFSSKEK